MCQVNGSHPVAPPSLARVPVSPVPRGQRYYEGATTSRPRIPGRLFVSLPGSARSSALRARLGGAPGWLEDPSGPGHLVSRRPICRHTLTRTQAGSHRFPGDPFHAFAPVQDPGRIDDPSPWRCRRCCPRSTHSEGSSDDNFEATHAASAPAAYASRRASPHAMQGSLPAGWLTFTGRELNPLDRDERVQNFMFVLLS
jgi:hypothetical protein